MEEFLKNLWAKINEWLPSLLYALCALAIGLLLLFIVTKIVRRILNKKVDPAMHAFVIGSVKIFMWAFIAIAVFSALGLNTASIITALGSAGIAVGLGLQGSLTNIASGVLLTVNKLFKAGDYIAVNGVEGVVADTDLMFTHLNTYDNKHISIPNSSVTSANVINYSYNEMRRVDMEIPISYNDDCLKAKEVLMLICSGTAGVEQSPAPAVSVKGFSDSSLTMFVRVWCKKDAYWDVYFAINERVKTEFDRQGIVIPFNQIDVHFFPPEELQRENKG